MAPPSLQTILNSQSISQIAAQISAYLANPGGGLPPFPLTSWGVTSAGPYIVGSEAQVLAQVWQSIVDAVSGGFLQTSNLPQLVSATTGTSPWTDIDAQQQFNLVRQQSQSTIGPFNFTAPTGVGPYTVAAGQLLITANTGATFTNNVGFTIPNAGSQAATVTAVTPGSTGNIANGTSLSLTTALPGVTVSTYPAMGSPVWFTSAYSDTGLAQAGSDVESDASLIARCLNLWISLGTGSPVGAWINWAFAASNEVRYANVIATGLGSVNIYLYGSSGPVSTTALLAVQAYCAARLPMCSFIAPGSSNVAGAIPTQGLPISAVPININPMGQTNFSAVIYCPSTATTAALASAATALQLLVQSTPVGGYPIGPGTPDTFGISNSAFETAITNSNTSITKTVVSVHNGSGNVTSGDVGNDLIFTPSSGVPRIAQVPPSPGLPTSWGLTVLAV